MLRYWYPVRQLISFPDCLPVEQHNCVFVPETTSDEECVAMFEEHLALSIAEARILRDLLNRPDVQAILDTRDQ